MSPKKTRGFTLVELSVSLALLAILVVGVVNSLYSAQRTYDANQRMREDEYNARYALLFITREVHLGVSDIVFDPDKKGLTLKMLDNGSEIRFFRDSGGVLRRVAPDGASPIPFREVELADFEAYDPYAGDADNSGRWLTLHIICNHGLELETTVSRLRIPQAQNTAGE